MLDMSVVMDRFGRSTTYSQHVRVVTVAELPRDVYQAVCITCHPERKNRQWPVGKDRKYLAVANRDAVAHARREHGEGR